MKIFSRIAFALIVFLAVSACSKPNANTYSDGIIHVKVDAEDTKASILDGTSLRTYGKFTMEAYVDRDVYEDVEGKKINKKVGNAYFGPETGLEENVEYIDAGTGWQLSRLESGIPQPCYWVSSDGNMSFWSYVKSRNSLNSFTIDKINSALYLTSPNVDATNGVKMVFDYSLPTPTESPYDDATNQEDLIFSYWQDALENSAKEDEEPVYPEKQDVWVHFYHALSQIRFCFSNDDGTFAEGLKIKSIGISDVASGGTCTFWGKIGMDEFTKYTTAGKYDNTNGSRDVASVFSWNGLKAKETYRQNYDVTVSSSTETYSGWNKSSYTKESTTYKLFTCQNVFMMIPQTLSSPSSICLTIVDSSKPEGQQEQEFIAYINDTWEAGKYYTYKLNYKNDQISFTATLVAWGNISEAMVFDLD